MAVLADNVFGLLTYQGGDPTLASSWSKSGPHRNVAYMDGNVACASEIGRSVNTPSRPCSLVSCRIVSARPPGVPFCQGCLIDP